MKPKEIGAFEAKARLSELLERVGRGDSFIITKRGKPVAELRPAGRKKGLRFGADAGRIRVAEDFDAPLPEMQEYSE